MIPNPAERAARIAHTLDEFCWIYHCSRTRAYVEIKLGRLKARKMGKRTIITDPDARAWLASLPVLDTSD